MTVVAMVVVVVVVISVRVKTNQCRPKHSTCSSQLATVTTTITNTTASPALTVACRPTVDIDYLSIANLSVPPWTSSLIQSLSSTHTQQSSRLSSHNVQLPSAPRLWLESFLLSPPSSHYLPSHEAVRTSWSLMNGKDTSRWASSWW
ncbi:hypothetical protein E2C01_004532 [Portunus trituberculatus]|uniref:Uncharacterized protein n=1 Tax=Portunus trituberculatus TaxID=210409 RepID=A0A5B7CS08_PORTR|nr:hypothetical protein [Portunus trituberculatus]